MKKMLQMAGLTAALIASQQASAAFKAGEHFPNAEIPYVLDASLSPSARQKFLMAIDYLRDNTSFSFKDITSGPIPSRRMDYVIIKEVASCVSVGVGKGSLLQTRILGYPSLTIGMGASGCGEPGVDIVVHELFHVLGFLHEHSRKDAPDYIEYNTSLIQSEVLASDPGREIDHYPINILFFYPQNFGSYDYESITHYVNNQYYASRTPNPIINNTAPEDTDTGQRALVTYLKELDGNRFVRLILADNTKYFSFDNNLWLNIGAPNPLSNIPNVPAAVSQMNAATKWTDFTAQFAFEYTGQGNQFYLKHRESNKYLMANIPNKTYGTFHLSSIAEADSKWELVFSSDRESFKLKHVSTNRYLVNLNGSANTTDNMNDPNTSWLVKLARQTNYGTVYSTYDNPRMSIMDKVALHWRYGFPFRLKTKDSTPNNLTDNPTLQTQYYGQVSNQLNVSPGQLRIDSEPNSNLNWPSAQWFLERVNTSTVSDYNSTPSKWVRFRNVSTGGYLHTENNGQLQLNTGSTLNGSGAVLNNQWHSAHWELVIAGDYFLIKNRHTGAYLYNDAGVLSTGMNMNDAYRWHIQPIERNLYARPNLSCNWCL
jgi:hypothetical protein